ncbi:PAAR domain-containing protein [Neisseriaceae bacterium TC5R-5]|nr:PAAR domain-containing protein [Neisseriaceae bacterium TC5R-5]
MKKMIVLGDLTDGGGAVVSANPAYQLWGKPLARLHDAVLCPKPYPNGQPHGPNRIAEASGPLFGDLPVALEGDRCECGCRLLGSANATVA